MSEYIDEELDEELDEHYPHVIEKLERVNLNRRPVYKFEIREVTPTAKILCFTTYTQTEAQAWQEFEEAEGKEESSDQYWGNEEYYK